MITKKNISFLTGMNTLILVVATWFIAGSASSQTEPPVGKLPKGFTVASKSVSPAQVSFEANKPHNMKSCMQTDPDIHISYSWRAMPEASAKMIAASMARQTESSSAGTGSKTQSTAKKQIKNGTLVLTKSTTPQIGTSCNEWVTYGGSWSGVSDNGLLVISVKNGAGAEENIKAWIESLVP